MGAPSNSRSLAELERRFALSHNGMFRERYGKVGPNVPYSQKKVCLVATDKALLVALLDELAERDDCFYVKYTVRPRDGMHLGRCFLTSDTAAAQLCQQLKSHPKLMVTIQDDDFFNSYRNAMH